MTANLCRQFYERLGEDVANELVDWLRSRWRTRHRDFATAARKLLMLNAVDATYRADLRELNELNFARFDAKLEQRITEVNSRIDRVVAEWKADLQTTKAELLKWMFVFWATTALGLVGLLLR